MNKTEKCINSDICNKIDMKYSLIWKIQWEREIKILSHLKIDAYIREL